MTFMELWDEKSQPVPVGASRTKHPVRAVIALITIPILIGLLGSLLVAPYALGASAVVKASPELWNSIDADTSAFDNVSAPSPVVVEDASGAEFARFYAENRVPLTYDNMGSNVVNALVDTEDVRFWTRTGVDDTGITRAALKNLLGAHEGASTITMQLVQNLRQTVASYGNDSAAYQRAQASTVPEKLQEIKYSLEYEKKHSKKEILESYLNIVYFGNSYYGLGAAAQGYFSVDAKDLTIPQAALIAGLVQSPEAYNPTKHPEAAKTRRNEVLDRMVAAGTISETDAGKYKAEPVELKVNPNPVGNSGCADSKYPYYCALVKEEVLSSTALGKDDSTRQMRFYAGGFTVKTGLNTTVMAALDDAAKNFSSNPYQTGLAEVQPGTGLIQGISQSTSFGDTQVVYATSKLQIGSTFKPITIAASVDSGVNPYQTFNVSDGYVSRIFDSPPGGYKNAESTIGNMDLRTAVKYSNNVFFVKLLEQVGVRKTATVARSLGLTGVPDNLTGREGSLTLGAYEASPLQMSAAFATFAAGGTYCVPHAITEIRGVKVDNDCNRVISANAAATVNDVLTEPLTSGGTAETLKFNADVRVKSGSTDDYSVVWLDAYTPNGSIAGWVADPDNPNANPVRNVNVYGVFHSVGHGGDTAGTIVNRAFNESGIGSAAWPSAGSSGDIITKTDEAPDVKGMSTDAAISALLDSGREVTVKNTESGTDTALSWDEDSGVLSVQGRDDIDGYRYYVNDDGTTVQEKPNS